MKNILLSVLVMLGTLVVFSSQGRAAVCETNGTTRKLACPIGHAGVRAQTCVANVWTDTTSCSVIRCIGGGEIGATAIDTTSCPANFIAVATPNFTKTCMLPFTNATVGRLYATHTNCKPAYISCSGTVSRRLACPIDSAFPSEGSLQGGEIIQQCNRRIYQTVKDACAPPTCDGQPVGAYRAVQGTACTAGKVGTVLEICTRSGQWLRSSVNCSS